MSRTWEHRYLRLALWLLERVHKSRKVSPEATETGTSYVADAIHEVKHACRSYGRR